MKIVTSVAGVPIRLTAERLEHIQRRHPEMGDEAERILETVSAPDYVQEGDAETLIAVRHYDSAPLTGKYCAVIYRELGREDGLSSRPISPASPPNGGISYGSGKTV